MYKVHETPLLTNNRNAQQEMVERNLEREKALTQKELAPVLILTVTLTALLAYNRASALGLAWFALRKWMDLTGQRALTFFLDPLGELTALTLLTVAIIHGRLGGDGENDCKQNIFCLTAVLSASFGALVVYMVNEQYSKPHFISPHSQMGILTFAAISIYTAATVPGCNPRNGTHRMNAKARDFHNHAGKLIVVLGLLTASAGIMELEVQPVPNIVAWVGSLTTFFPLLA